MAGFVREIMPKGYTAYSRPPAHLIQYIKSGSGGIGTASG